ncbi:uncharacterized protein [Littorina saxatilis]|uniref:uncharacterized protein n=1 Tax=Littorina saxatilis TaxID=31220 RepID=UPI0038B50205
MMEQAMTEKTMTERTMIEQTMTGHTRIEQATTEQTMTEQTTTGQTMTGQTMTEQTTTGQTTTGQAMTEQTMTELTLAEQTSPQEKGSSSGYVDDDDELPLDLTDDGQDGIKHLCGTIPFDLTYITSLFGFLELVIAALSLIAYLCFKYSEVCYRMSDGGNSFYASMALSTCVTMSLWFLMRVVALCQRMPVDSWRMWEMVIIGIYGTLFISSDIIIATQTCGHASLEASVIFAFLAVIMMGIHFYFSFEMWKATQSASALRAVAMRQDAEQIASTNA